MLPPWYASEYAYPSNAPAKMRLPLPSKQKQDKSRPLAESNLVLMYPSAMDQIARLLAVIVKMVLAEAL